MNKTTTPRRGSVYSIQLNTLSSVPACIIGVEMQSPTNFPTASAWLAIVVTNAPDLSFLVSSGVASMYGEALRRCRYCCQ
jgi:hypothetical protein